MKGTLQNKRVSHPECTCGKRFASMGKLIGHWDAPCDEEDTDAATQ